MIPLLLIPFVALATATDYPEVQLSGGLVSGYDVETGFGRRGSVFLGIPFAEPPIGKLRFAPPEPVRPWPGVVETRAYAPGCRSNSSQTRSPIWLQDEDCLYLNVFTAPECIGAAVPCPVLFYIHGGGRKYDSPSMFLPSVMVEAWAGRGVVAVLPSYRLGVFGFWTDGEAGNWARHDQLLALAWTRREIGAFGGDPARVTIMGHSSGAADAAHLSIIPAAEGLFRGVVVMSGSADEFVGHSADEADKEIARRLGCGVAPDLLDCVRALPSDTIVAEQRAMEDEGLNSFVGGRIDGILYTAPMAVLRAQRRPLPMMVGATAEEFGFTGASAAERKLMKSFGRHSPNTRQLCQAGIASLGRLASPSVTEDCLRHYANRTGDLKNDAQLFVPMLADIRSLAEAGGQFDYKKDGQAAHHSQDLDYIFRLHPEKVENFDARDLHFTAQNWLPLFLNFIKTGRPTFQANRWVPVPASSPSIPFYSIDSPFNTMRLGFRAQTEEFWFSPTRLQSQMQLSPTPSSSSVGVLIGGLMTLTLCAIFALTVVVRWRRRSDGYQKLI